MASDNVQVNVTMPAEMVSEVEDRVDSSVIFENRSQLFRAAVRSFLDESSEFESAK